MNNIDWNDAPGWANYAAMDCDGEWYWYAEKPVPRSEGCYWGSYGRMEHMSPQPDQYLVDRALRKSTLQERPKETDKSHNVPVPEYIISEAVGSNLPSGEITIEFDMPEEDFDEWTYATRKEVKEIVKDAIVRYYDSFGSKRG